MIEFSGNTAVVTGGGSGIGRALALALAQEGMNVVVAGTNQGRLDAVADQVRALGVRASARVCDVSSRQAVRDLADFAFAEYGEVRLLVNNAAVVTSGPFLEHRDADWDWVYGVVLMGVVHGVQAFYPRMVRQGGGHIFNVHSQSGLVPDWFLNHGPYTSAKHAVLGLSVALRAEAEQHNVGVTVLIPGGTNSDLMLTERSRPETYQASDPPPSGQISLRDPDLVPREEMYFIEPEEAARIAIEGLKAGKPFIATHKGLKAVTKDYFDRILTAYD